MKNAIVVCCCFIAIMFATSCASETALEKGPDPVSIEEGLKVVSPTDGLTPENSIEKAYTELVDVERRINSDRHDTIPASLLGKEAYLKGVIKTHEDRIEKLKRAVKKEVSGE